MSAGARLLDLLPDIFRTRDGEEALALAAQYGFAAPDPVGDDPEGPLTSLLAALEEQLNLLEAQVDNLYEDQFAETCAEWVIPYIGALIGARIVDVDDVGSARRQLADTIRNRRSKGTAAALARIAGDVLDTPAEAIEYREHLIVSLNSNFPGDGRAMIAAINGPEGRAIGLPDYLGQRSVELRDMREGGRFAAPNIGIRAWTIPALFHREVVPIRVTGGDPGRFRFSPTGADLPLWRTPDTDRSSVSRLSLAEIPGAIPLRHAVDHPELYYGLNLSVAIAINNAFVPLTDVCFCDLSNRTPAGTSWNFRGSADELDRIRIDPRLGRFALPASMLGLQANAIRLLYHYGMAVEAGGGGYADAFEMPAGAATIGQALTRAQATAALAAAAADLANVPAIRIDYGGTIETPASVALPAGEEIIIAAGPGVWPTLEMAAPLRFTGGAGSTLTLAGLRFSGNRIRIDTAGLAELVLVDCTIIPGVSLNRDGSPATPGGVTLSITQAGCRVRLERCIIGAVRVEQTVRLTVTDSVIDSAAPNDAALSAPAGARGGILSADRSTFVGDVALFAVDEISDSLFLARGGRTNVAPAVAADLIQQGCVRYSCLPPGARVPRRYRCYPPEGAVDPVQPVPASLRYGEPAYVTLVPASPRAVLTGAENGREMGCMNNFSWHRRAIALGRELPDWTPFSMVAGVEMMSE
jgi:hypothetical protein